MIFCLQIFFSKKPSGEDPDQARHYVIRADLSTNSLQRLSAEDNLSQAERESLKRCWLVNLIC